MKKAAPLLLAFLLLNGCQGKKQPEPEQKIVEFDLEQIRERGYLIAATGYGATSYFIYKGRPMGYEYELLELLARHLDIDIKILITKDLDNVFEVLNSGEADIIVLGLTITKDRAKKVAFTKPYNIIRQVLVQRKPEKWRTMKQHKIDKILIKNPIDLIGKKVHVWGGSSYYSRLVNLSDEIGGDIDIVAVAGSLSTEDLIGKVARGEIEYTVADENIALISQAYYSNIDVGTAVSFPQQIAWAVRKTSPMLLEAVNKWSDAMKDCTDYYVIYNKYYKNRTAFRERAKSEYYSSAGGKISEYDDLIKEHAEKIEWDWRLLASLIYQESGFDPDTQSWAGATGLMQLVPETGSRFGAVNLKDPVENIMAGSKYLQWLGRFWEEIPDSSEQTKFVLASFNAGQGHIRDAQRLAEKYGKNPYLWDDHVGYYLLKKSNKEYFNDDVVIHGYCRGEEPYNYVREILERYEHYRKHLN